MKIVLSVAAVLLASCAGVSGASAQPATEATAETAVESPPKGEVIQREFAASKIYPGTTRNYWIYVPAQYDGTTPACVHIQQDGIQCNAPQVFDRLIHERKMPVTIGVFVTPGRVPAARPEALDRYNRSHEYDRLGGDYARFLLEELLPAVEQQKAADGRRLVLSHSGNDRSIGGIYVTAPGWDGTSPSTIHFITPEGVDTVVHTGNLKFSNGICLSPDQSLLYVADSRSRWVWSFVVQPDGSLAQKQKFFHLHVPDTADDSGADGLRVDRDGRLWVATRMGIQVCDQAGRVNCILPSPNGKVSNLCFGGPNFDHLLATCGDKVFVRKVKVTGAPNFLPPTMPAKPKL